MKLSVQLEDSEQLMTNDNYSIKMVLCTLVEKDRERCFLRDECLPCARFYAKPFMI